MHRSKDPPFGAANNTAKISSSPAAVTFAQEINPEEVSEVIRTLARRPVGREAILNSPTVHYTSQETVTQGFNADSKKKADANERQGITCQRSHH